MIILSRRKILSILGCIIIFTLAYIVTGYNVTNIKTETIQTVALPVDSKVIIIDARTWSSRRRCRK